jgi:hypothetical protein
MLYHVSESLKQGGIRHAPIIGVKLNELDDERGWGWGHKDLSEKMTQSRE